jgi:hypothetical protein
MIFIPRHCPRPQEIIVAGNDDVRPGSHCTFEDSVIVRIVGNGQTLLRTHTIRDVPELDSSERQPIAIPAELVP